MLQKIITFSIKNKLLVGVFTIGLIAWGVFSLKKLPIDAVPDITNNQVQVITTSPSNGAEDIERFITFPVEQTMATIPGIEEIRSFSRFGLSVVTTVFKDNIDVYWARQQVNERLSQAQQQIPEGMGTPEMAPVTTGLGEIFQYIIHIKPGYENKYTAMDLRTIQDWIVRRQLLGVEGVADVSSFGGYLKQYEVALNPEKLNGMHLSIADVFTALKKNNQNTGGAYIDKNPAAYFVRSIGLIGSIDDIKNIVVKNTDNGTPILLRDVGTVQYGHATRYGAMTRNNEGEVTGALVLMLKGANSSQVIAKVKERIAQIEKTLPEGVIIEPYLDRTKLVDRAIHTVSTNLIEGALIVIFVLVLFLGNLRAGLIVASVIPLSMLFAISLMNVFGVSGNLMSLGAIDFGLIVDGAVIIVEATMHHLALRKLTRRLTQDEMNREVQQSSIRMLSSSAFGTIIILIVYLPLLALVGIEGKMFKPMAQTVTFAILGAFILSLTYVPMMSSLFLSKKTSHKTNVSDRIITVLHHLYQPTLRWVLNHKLIVFSLSAGLFAGALLLFNTMGAEFIPTLDEGDFAVETRALTGSSLSKTIDAVSKSAEVLKQKFPEVIDVVGKIGTSEIATDPMPVEACDMIIMLRDKDEWTSASTRDELAEKMQKALEDAVPGVTYGFQQPIQMRFNELIAGARQDVVVKIFGEDLDQLSDYARRIGKLATGVKGAADMYVEQVTGLPQIVVNYKRAQVAQYGLNIEDINQVISAGFAGEAAGQVFEGEKRFDLVVRLDTANRKNIDDLKNLYVPGPYGTQIPISQLADVELRVGPNQIQREDTKRRIIVGFNVRGRDVESVVKELQKKINVQIKFAPGYYVDYGGTFQNLEEAKGRLSIAVPAALLLIGLLLYLTFNSIKQAILIFTAIPLSAIGGVIALWIRDMPFSISAGVGFIALFGVAVLNGIVLIAEFNSLQKEGMKDMKEIIFKGTKVRLRPIVMTATVASLGFLPMALSQGSGAEVQRPLATVVIGFGPVTTTTHADFATSSSTSESNRTSTNYAKDITERSVSRLKERVREERTRKTLEEIEEINIHGFDNTEGTGHVTGIYRWVDKIYLAQVVNYGQRLMLEFIVPEPAAFYLYAERNKKVEGVTLTEPLDPETVGSIVGTESKNFWPSDLHPWDYLFWVKYYKVQGVSPPPPQFIVIGTAVEHAPTQQNTNVEITQAYKELQVPEGYYAKNGWVTYSFLDYGGGWFDLMIGNNSIENAGPFTLNSESNIVPISLSGVKNAYSFTVEIVCESSTKTFQKWQLETYGAIINAYQKLKSEYDEQLNATRIRQGVQIAGRNPNLNREIEKEELKKGCLAFLTRPLPPNTAFDQFGSILDAGSQGYSQLYPQSPFNYPEIALDEAASEGTTIQFMEQAFEWNQITYLFYSYFWGRKENWVKTHQLEDTDPLFTKFLQAGAARVLVPVRPNYEQAVIHYLSTLLSRGTGEIWNGGEAPTLDDHLFISVADEIKAQTGGDNTSVKIGEPWDVKVPTSLVYLDPIDSPLPDWSSVISRP